DPIGGPVGVSADEDASVDRGPLTDPLRYGRTQRWPLPEPILGHGDYEADPAFAQERAALYHAVPRSRRPVPVQQGAGGQGGAGQDGNDGRGGRDSSAAGAAEPLG